MAGWPSSREASPCAKRRASDVVFSQTLKKGECCLVLVSCGGAACAGAPLGVHARTVVRGMLGDSGEMHHLLEQPSLSTNEAPQTRRRPLSCARGLARLCEAKVLGR